MEATRTNICLTINHFIKTHCLLFDLMFIHWTAFFFFSINPQSKESHHFYYYAGNRPWFSLMEQSLPWHKIIIAIPYDSAKALIASSGWCSVSMSHSHTVRIGSPAAWRSESLSICTGTDNARYSCWASPWHCVPSQSAIRVLDLIHHCYGLLQRRGFLNHCSVTYVVFYEL